MLKVNNLIDTKAVIALGLMTSVIGFGTVFANAQTANTTVNLTINAGVATLYAGDAVDNDDICTPANDTQVIETITCSAAERTVTLDAKSVLNIRQETNTIVNDIVLDDLRGLALADYTVTATMCDLVGNQTSPVTYPLGYTGDGNSALFARTNASVGTVAALKPASTVTAYNANNWTKGSNTTVTDTTTSISVFATNTDVVPGRYEIDAVGIGFELPAYIAVGSYTCNMTYTLTL